MPKTLRFWRNVTLIGFAHVAVITGLVHLSHGSKAAAPQSVFWMSSAVGNEAAISKTFSSPAKQAPARTESKSERPNEPELVEDRPVLLAAKSDIQLPEPTASASSTPKANPTPRIKVTPKPKPKPKPTATPRPKASPKKLVLAKAKNVPRLKPFRVEAKDEEADAPKMKIDKSAGAAPELPAADSVPQTAAHPSGNATGAAAPAGGGGQAQFGWYGSMLHDRFYSEWAQPTRVASTPKNSVLAKIRIEKDGRVSSFDIVRPSGNSELDQSVAAVAKRVTQVEPLPDGLGSGDHYDVKISFELNAE
ncbi:MAG: TonB family protein [Chthoniobacterales bacterium]